MKFKYTVNSMSNTKGFTLIELLVAIALASIIISALLAVFTSFIHSQVSSQDERNALESVRFMLSDISRDIYLGYNYQCGQTKGSGCSCLTFSDQVNRSVKIRHNVDASRVEKSVRVLDPNPHICREEDAWVPLTDDSTSITSLIFGFEEGNAGQNFLVKIQTKAQYEIDGEVNNLALRTQVTRRIFEVSQSEASSFRIGTDTASAGVTYYLVYAFRMDKIGNLLDKNGIITTNQSEAIICRDTFGTEYEASRCEHSQRPVAVEFGFDGLYILSENGLLFQLSNSGIQKVESASGTLSPIETSILNSSITRVLGRGGCRFCDDDPRGITSIFSGGNFIYAYNGNTGALYKVDGTTAVKILPGGFASGKVSLIDGSPNKLFTLFSDSDGVRKLRLYTPSTLGLQVGDVAASGGVQCSEFNYLSNFRCRQLIPDSNKTNTIAVRPNSLQDITLSRIDKIQVVGDTFISIAYRDTAVSPHLLIISSSEQRNHTGNALVSSGKFAHGNGLSIYTAPCDNGSAICSLSSPTEPFDDSSSNKLSLNSAGPIVDLLHFRSKPIGISSKGKLLFFDVSNSRVSSVSEIPIFNLTEQQVIASDGSITIANTKRVLCDTIVQNLNDDIDENDRQLFFNYISEKHLNSDKVALIASLQRAMDDFSLTRNEILLLVPTSS